MAEFRSVEIDFDVHKRIELARESFSETPNAVLRRLLGIDSAGAIQPMFEGKVMRAWSGKGVMLPHGTRVRMDYNGRTHEGEILDGLWLVEGERFSSPSAAAGGVARTKDGKRTNLDGWIYWWARPPGMDAWIKLSDLREVRAGPPRPVEHYEGAEAQVKHSDGSVSDLPMEIEVKAELEAYLRKVNRPIKPSEAYRKLADKFGLTTEQRSRLMENGRCHWENRVQWARNDLVKAGIMSRKPYGVWSLAQ